MFLDVKGNILIHDLKDVNSNKVSLLKSNYNTCGKAFEFSSLIKQDNEQFHKRYSCKKSDYTSYGARDLTEHKKIPPNTPWAQL